MLICPDCASELSALPDGSPCQSCGWSVEYRDKIPDFLSSADRKSPLLRQYVANYEEIATDDLEQTIQDSRYLEIQTNRFFSDLGDISGLSVCDVGIGQGLLLDLIKDAAPSELTAVDIAAPYLERYGTSNAVRLILANAENLPFANEFDLLVATDLLEHVLNIGDVLFSVHRALQAGGRFAVRVPYRENLNMYSRHRGVKYDLVHLRDFDKRSLTRLLTGAGFEVERVQFDGFDPERKRHFIERFDPVSRRFDAEIIRRYGSRWEVARMGSRLGNLLMRPIEIKVLARKTRHLTVP